MEARPYGEWVALVDGRRYCIAPTLHQPLSHGAKRRDSSPFRGAKGWEAVCGVCASVYHDADTVVFLPPVRGGVLDAPWSRDCRAALDASIRPDRLHPRLIRCASLASNAQRFQSRGRSPRTISYGRPRLSVIPGRAGVEARPYEAWVRGTDAVSQPANGAPRTVRPTTCGKVSA